MILTTKYNMGDLVYFINKITNHKNEIIQDNGIQSTSIEQIIVLEYDYVYVTDDGNFYECDLFATKEDAKKWLKSIHKWNIYFEDSGKQTLVGSALTYDDAVAIMNQKIKDSGFKSYYTRVTKFSDTEFWFDYGSHTTFYWIREE